MTSIAVLFYLTQYSGVLSPQQQNPLAMLPTTPTVGLHGADLSWYAPSKNPINDLSGVIKGEGIYGFIYNTSVTPDEEYGTYNWCNMPHTRKREYQKPDSEYELKYVEVVSEDQIAPTRNFRPF